MIGEGSQGRQPGHPEVIVVNPDWRARYEVAVEATRKAGELALRYFDTRVNVEWKSNQTPVTVADREAEQLLRSALLGKFRNDGFLGEESGEDRGTSGFRWIIDPIDGTRSFVRSIPIWGTLVGLEHKGELIAGVTHVPAMGQLFRALRGDGAYRDDRRIRVSDIDRLEDAQVFYSLLSWFLQSSCRGAFEELMGRCQRQRGFGDFYGFLLVAQGSGEVMFEYGVSPWDVAALVPIVEEAGGKCSDWQGTPAFDRPHIVATNGKLHAEVLDIIRRGCTPDFQPHVIENRLKIT